MAEQTNEVRLKVGELTAREEAGRGIVRIDSNTMSKLQVKEGDVIEIEGSKISAAIAVRSYPADVGLNIIRMDGITRRNVGSGVGEYVKLRKAEVKEAKSVTLAPAQKGIMIHISPNLIKQNIFMRPMVKGDIISPSPVGRRRSSGLFEDFFGMDIEEFFPSFTPFSGDIKFIVVNTSPAGVVKIGEITELEILPQLPESMKLEDRAVPTVTYEDVGGIREIIHKVREMIELPLRHPELFERLGIEPPKGVLLYGPPGTGKTLLAKAVANESGAYFISISAPEIMSKWYGESLPYDEKILVSEKGMVKRKPIGEVVESGNKDIQVLSFDEQGKIRFAKVTDLIKHKNTGKLLEVVTKSGRKIKVTDYHSLFTLDGGKIKSIRTSELIPKKSFIAVPRFIPQAGTNLEEINILDSLKENDLGLVTRNVQGYVKRAIEKIGADRVAGILKCNKNYIWFILNKNIGIRISKFMKLMEAGNVTINDDVRIYSRTKSLPAKIKLTDDFLTFLGLWVAEGSYTKNGNVRLTVHRKEASDVKALCERLFGKVAEYEYKENATDIYISSTVLYKVMKDVLGLMGGARNKHAPDIVFNLSKEKVAAFLTGYLSGDGSIYANQHGVPQIEASTASEKLADDLMHLFLYFGIIAKTYDRKNEDAKRVVLTGVDNLLKFKQIGFIDWKKNSMVTDYLTNVAWKRSDQIPSGGLDPIISHIPQIKQWANSETIGRGILGQVADMDTAIEYGLDEDLMQDAIRLVSNDIYWDRVEEIKEINNEKYVYDISVSPSENFLAGFGGIFAHNSEQNIKRIFEEAEKNAPAIIFIDEIDAIAPKREEVSGEVERRVVSTLLTQMDGLKKRGKVIVIAATNRPNSLDSAIRRAGRFDREIEFPVPDREGRLDIFKIHTRNMPMAKDVDLNHLSEITYGFVGSDIWAVGKEAAMSALRRVLPEIKWKEDEELPKEIIEKLIVTKDDFEDALRIVEPSAMREVMVEIPNVKWEDIGGLDEVKEQLQEMVEWPLKSPDSFERLGISPPRGILLYGPPGTGKTLLAKAVANEAGANFISIKGPEMFSKWVGESEKAIRDVFRRARQVAPAIIFLDEIDAIAPRRGMYSGSGVTETVVAQLLSEISGLEELKGVVVMAATNRPDIVDSALLRPGRFDRMVLVPAPDIKSRLEIFKVHTKKMPLTKDVDLKELARKTEGFSGADIESLCREAGMESLREDKKSKEVKMKHFDKMLAGITPSVTRDVVNYYEKFSERKKKTDRGEEKDATPRYIG